MKESTIGRPDGRDPAEAIIIGCALPRDRWRLLERNAIAYLEIPETFASCPSLKTVKRWRNQLGASIDIGIRAWHALTRTPGTPGLQKLPKDLESNRSELAVFGTRAASLEAYDQVVEVAERLAARAIIFDSDANFSPTVANRKTVELFFSTIKRPQDIDLVWSPRGLWESSEITEICDQLGIICGIDPLHNDSLPAGNRSYFRLEGASYTDAEIGQLITHGAAYEDSFIVFTAGEVLRGVSRASLLQDSLH